jgi:Zn-dependent protease
MAHAWVALRLGDTTAKDLGRITLNPIPHIDLFGSIIIPLLSILTTGRVLIAWAKPVPIDPSNFKNFKRDDSLVTVAGPLSNLIIAFLCVAGFISVYFLAGYTDFRQGTMIFDFVSYILKMFYAGILLNVSLAVFNLLPVPPLDGSHLVANILPDELGMRFRQIGFFGIFIILILFNYIPGFAQFFMSVIMLVAEPYFQILNYFIK